MVDLAFLRNGFDFYFKKPLDRLYRICWICLLSGFQTKPEKLIRLPGEGDRIAIEDIGLAIDFQAQRSN
jgi:hypothetical protein